MKIRKLIIIVSTSAVIFSILILSAFHYRFTRHLDAPIFPGGGYTLAVGISDTNDDHIDCLADIYTDYRFYNIDSEQLKSIESLIGSDSLMMNEVNIHIGYGDYEVAIIFKTDEYTLGSSYESVRGVYSFAYSYETKKVYYFCDEKVYEIKNSGELKKIVGKSIDPKAKIIFDHFAPEGYKTLRSDDYKCIYSDDGEFRYDRFWVGDTFQSDHYIEELNGYSANSFEEMLNNSANAISLYNYYLVVAYDRYTGNYRIEYKDYEEPPKHIFGKKVVVMYFSENFEFLYGYNR